MDEKVAIISITLGAIFGIIFFGISQGGGIHIHIENGDKKEKDTTKTKK